MEMKRHHCVILEWELEIVEWELDLCKTSWNHVSSPPNLILFFAKVRTPIKRLSRFFWSLRAWKNSSLKMNANRKSRFLNRWLAMRFQAATLHQAPKVNKFSDSKRHQTIDQIWVTIFKWMFGEITTVQVKITNHPIETTIVPGIDALKEV